MKKNFSILSLVAAVVLSSVAFGQDSEVSAPDGSSGKWSTVTGETVGEGNNVIHVQAGYPGLSGGWFHGMSEKFDLGARFTFNYGYESTTAIIPGLKPAMILKIGLMDNGKFNMALRFEPGVQLYFSSFGGGVLFGINLPAYLDMGIRINNEFSVVLGADLPMSLNLTPGVVFNIPIKFGGGIEYKINPDMALTFNTRFGPFIAAGGFGGFGFGGVAFAFDALFGLAFKL
jgi:hypothetical protein